MSDVNFTCHGEHSVIHISVKLLCCAHETDIILYVNCNSIRGKLVKLLPVYSCKSDKLLAGVIALKSKMIYFD